MKDPNKKVESARITKTLSDPIGFPTRWERSFIRLGKEFHPIGKRFPSVWENSLNPLGILFLPLDT